MQWVRNGSRLGTEDGSNEAKCKVTHVYISALRQEDTFGLCSYNFLCTIQSHVIFYQLKLAFYLIPTKINEKSQ